MRAAATPDELRPPDGPRSVVVLLDSLMEAGPIASACALVEGLLKRIDVDVVTCDVAGLDAPTRDELDVLLRAQLTARRMGRSVRPRHASPGLRAVLHLFALDDVLVCDDQDAFRRSLRLHCNSVLAAEPSA